MFARPPVDWQMLGLFVRIVVDPLVASSERVDSVSGALRPGHCPLLIASVPSPPVILSRPIEQDPCFTIHTLARMSGSPSEAWLPWTVSCWDTIIAGTS
jgi:hypothetical protein